MTKEKMTKEKGKVLNLLSRGKISLTLLKTIILVILILVFSFPAFAQGGMNLTIDSTPIELKNPLFIEKDKTLISLTDLSEQFEIEVENINEGSAFICKRDNNSIQFSINSIIANINSTNLMIDIAPKIVDGNIYVPMRATLESLGYEVRWNGENKATDISNEIAEGDEAINKDISTKDIFPTKYIAHGGGRINGLVYTNSKEAIENSYNIGHSLIELDMEWTTDDQLVLVHDWGNFAMYVGSDVVKPYSLKAFKELKMSGNLTTMAIEDLADWLEKNLGVYIVTDVKVNNVKALQTIRFLYPNLTDRFIPQIYNFGEYDKVKAMGYENIIFTMYMSNYTNDEILDFVKTHKVFAVTMPVSTAKTKLPSLLMNENVFTYTHTVNTKGEEQELQRYDVKGFYTDDLMP